MVVVMHAGYINNDWGAKPDLVASERATVVTIEREGMVDNKPPQIWIDQHQLYSSTSNDRVYDWVPVLCCYRVVFLVQRVIGIRECH
jgi:hypothetical protein